jgi:phage terminase small subunit
MANPRRPTALKVLNGSAAHHPERVNAEEPTPPTLLEVPAPPAYVPLAGRARKAWDDLAARAIALGVLTDADLPALASVCRDFAEYENARRDGEAWRRTDAAKRRYDAGLRAFGLTPSDRSRVHVTQKGTPSKMSGLLQPKGRTG